MTLITAILVKPVNGTLKRNESMYVAGKVLQAKHTITRIILPEKRKFSGCKFSGFCSCTVVFMWDVVPHHWVSVETATLPQNLGHQLPSDVATLP